MEPELDRSILPISDLADRRARRFEAVVRHLKNREDALIIDNDTGHAIGDRIRGAQNLVSFSDEQLRSMRGRVLSHNHSAGWSYPVDDVRHAGAGLSVMDARLLLEQGLSQIRAITPRYLYRLGVSENSDAPASHQPGTFSPEQSYRIVREVFILADLEFKALVRLGVQTEDEKDILVNHLAMIELSRRLGLEYAREEVP